MENFFDKNKALKIILNIAYKRNISQSKLIDGIYDYSHFNRMCNGKESVKLDILVLCCLKLGICFDDVLNMSKFEGLVELDKYYDKFEAIRINRNYKDLENLFYDITHNDKLHNLKAYKQFKNHILGIIQAHLYQNYKQAKQSFETAFESSSNNSIYCYNYHNLNREQIEILIDYSICCFCLGLSTWENILSFLINPNNKYASDKILHYVYPKISYNMSIIYLMKEDYKNSLIYAGKGIEFSRKTNNYIYLGYLYYNSACCLAMLNNHIEAKNHLNLSKNLLTIQNKENEFNEVYNKDCSLYFKDMN